MLKRLWLIVKLFLLQRVAPLIIYIAAMISCAPVSRLQCETACGVTIVSAVPPQDTYAGGLPNDSKSYLMNWYSCEELQRVEDLSLEAFQQFAEAQDKRFEPRSACSALAGTKISIRTERHWWDGSTLDGGFGNEEEVTAITHCVNSLQPWIEIGAQPPNDGTLTHEFAHVIQRCKPLGPAPLVGQDPNYDLDADQGGHMNWWRFGVYSSIAHVQAEYQGQLIRRDAWIEACQLDAGCANTFDGGYL